MSQNCVEKALECHKSGMTLNKVVDGKLVPCDEETTKQHLGWLESLSHEERQRIGDVTPAPRWVAEAQVAIEAD